MPSTNKTPNIGLNQWAGNEYPKKQDFNDDNLAIDNKIKEIQDSIPGEAPVSSVNTKTGAVVLSASDINTSSGQSVETQLAQKTTILTASGTANAITLDVTLADKGKYSFKAIADSTGAVTINGIPLKKTDGTAVSNLKVNRVYDFYYDATANSVFILAKAEGDATVGDVLAGKVFSNGDESGLVGTMDLSNLIPENIWHDVTINDVTGTIGSHDTKIFSTPGVYSWTPPKWLSAVNVTIKSSQGGAGGGGGSGYTTGGGNGGNGSSGGVTSFGSYFSVSSSGVGLGGEGSRYIGGEGWNSPFYGGGGYVTGGNGALCANAYPYGAGAGAGGGGNGGAAPHDQYYFYGGAGGGGSYPATTSTKTISITGGTPITITVGAGGKGGAGGTAGSGGGYTYYPGQNGVDGSGGKITITW